MPDLRTLIAKSSTDAELNRVRDAMRRGEKKTTPKTGRKIPIGDIQRANYIREAKQQLGADIQR